MVEGKVSKKFEKYYWMSGVIVVTIIVVVLAVTFVIIPSFNSLGQVGDDLKDQKSNLSVDGQKLEKLKSFKVKEDDLRKQSEIVYRAIPSKKEVGDSFIELDGLIHEAGGSNKKVASSDSTDSAQNTGSSGPANAPNTSSSNSQGQTMTLPAGVSALDYTTDVDFPSYQNFKTMLENSEKALRFVHLDDFKITTKDGAFKVKLSYTAFYRSEGSSSTGGQ